MTIQHYLLAILVLGLVNVSELDRMIEAALANGWQPVLEDDAPPNALDWARKYSKQ